MVNIKLSSAVSGRSVPWAQMLGEVNIAGPDGPPAPPSPPTPRCRPPLPVRCDALRARACASRS